MMWIPWKKSAIEVKSELFDVAFGFNLRFLFENTAIWNNVKKSAHIIKLTGSPWKRRGKKLGNFGRSCKHTHVLHLTIFYDSTSFLIGLSWDVDFARPTMLTLTTMTMTVMMIPMMKTMMTMTTTTTRCSMCACNYKIEVAYAKYLEYIPNINGFML